MVRDEVRQVAGDKWLCGGGRAGSAGRRINNLVLDTQRLRWLWNIQIEMSNGNLALWSLAERLGSKDIDLGVSI